MIPEMQDQRLLPLAVAGRRALAGAPLFRLRVVSATGEIGNVKLRADRLDDAYQGIFFNPDLGNDFLLVPKVDAELIGARRDDIRRAVPMGIGAQPARAVLDGLPIDEPG